MSSHVRCISRQRTMMAQQLPPIDLSFVVEMALNAILGYKQFKVNILVAIDALERRKAENPDLR